MIRRWMLRIGALALVPALLVACGGDDDDDTEGAPADTATTAATTKPAEGSATSAASASTAATSATAARTATTAASGGGSGGGKGAGCEVNITGDITASLKTKDELGAAGVFHWFTDEAKKQLGSDDGAFFVLNCTENPTVGGGAKEINLNFLAANESKEDHFPMKPAKYVIAGGEGLGSAKPGQISILFGLDDSLFRVTEPGTFNITRFDKERIVAEFSFNAEELFTTGKAKVVKVTGKLEFTCEATRVCRK